MNKNNQKTFDIILENYNIENHKIYKEIEKKIKQNIEIILKNEFIGKKLKEIIEDSEEIKGLIEDIKTKNLFEDRYFYGGEEFGEIKLDKPETLLDFISVLTEEKGLERLNFDYFNIKYLDDKIDDLISEIYSGKNKFYSNVCKKLKINPNMWKMILIARLFEIPKEVINNSVHYIIIQFYLPKAVIIDNNLYIQINELTTIEEIKLAWNKNIKPIKKIYEETNNYKSERRECKNIEDGEKIDKLTKTGLKSKEIMKSLNDEKERNSVLGYTDVLDKKRIYKKKIKER